MRLRFDDLVSRAAAHDGAESLRFPPVLPRRQLESAGYFNSFPHLAGVVSAFVGTEADAVKLRERASRHEDWNDFVELTDLVLTPAACYPVYPAVAARGPLPPGGVTIDTGGGCVFRREPSDDPARLQIFHLREIVRIGEPRVVAAWRTAWRERALGLIRRLGLDARVDVAADPFFGRSGRILAAGQRNRGLKYEISVAITGEEPTAVASFNDHEDHFVTTYGIRRADGGVAHSACIGFGHERMTLALFRAHGFDRRAWPAEVRRILWPPP